MVPCAELISAKRLGPTVLFLTLLPAAILCSYHSKDEDSDLQTCSKGEDGLDCNQPFLSVKHMLEESLNDLLKTASPLQGTDFIYTIITFKNAKENQNLQDKFKLTVTSLLTQSSTAILFLIIGDETSQSLAKLILSQTTKENNIDTQYQVANVDAEAMARELHTVVEPMQRHFSSKPGAYYSDSLFFLSIAIHRVMPDSISKVIMLDADLKFLSDITQLHGLFEAFTEQNVMGIARDNQPVYRHTFSHYRSLNPGTRVGEPPPNGLTGFNSGVLLLNLEAMRKSSLYNSLINEKTLTRLSEKYKFKGHLGDQDFFTLMSMEHEELFYVLPCGWNRQLCKWWKNHGYEREFDEYYKCDGPIHIYHGNCNTKIPVTAV